MRILSRFEFDDRGEVIKTAVDSLTRRKVQFKVEDGESSIEEMNLSIISN